jgi:hypothetical protein
MGDVISLLKNDYGINQQPITTCNPQTNAMIKRAHQTIHNMIQSKQIKSADKLHNGSWNGILLAVGFAMQSTVHTTTQTKPAQLVFNCDAMHNVQFEANWQYIKECKQRLIIQNDKHGNAK